MTTEAITPLRQRMIEDMNARKLCRASATAGINARGYAPTSAGGRGYLPRPRGGVAFCQRRSRQPRPVEGDVGHRALPYGGPRRPRRGLRGLLAHAHRLQLL